MVVLDEKSENHQSCKGESSGAMTIFAIFVMIFNSQPKWQTHKPTVHSVQPKIKRIKKTCLCFYCCNKVSFLDQDIAVLLQSGGYFQPLFSRKTQPIFISLLLRFKNAGTSLKISHRWHNNEQSDNWTACKQAGAGKQ